MKLCMYVGYHDANNVSNFGGEPVTNYIFKTFFLNLRHFTGTAHHSRAAHHSRDAATGFAAAGVWKKGAVNL